ncbi:Protein of unknown function [Pseudonocardia thermophila]|jgi:hypothetical protein|uniref:DUF998 domain-containing protein n=1 Tax=Pseudonocardia thermophila TaxID=1848 RepID=A0A1M6ZP95_PSETH|nr:Protein of unknown function [Pseudonocardia thermophila]
MTIAHAPPRSLAPARPALAGFAVAGAILVALDVRSPAMVLTQTISTHATTAARLAFVVALLASCAGVAVALGRAWRQVTAGRATDLLLLSLWPVGMGIASFFDQNTQSWTGTVHNVAVGAAIVGVHLAALRTRNRPLMALTAVGAATMAGLLVLIGLHVLGVPDVPVGVVERVLVVICVVLVVATLKVRRSPQAADQLPAMFTIQETPNRSVNIPKVSPHGAFSSGTTIDPPADSPSQKRRS